MLTGKRIGEIKVGDKTIVEKTISETDIYLFSGITGDLNPVHVNQKKQKKQCLKGE